MPVPPRSPSPRCAHVYVHSIPRLLFTPLQPLPPPLPPPIGTLLLVVLGCKENDCTGMICRHLLERGCVAQTATAVRAQRGATPTTQKGNNDERESQESTRNKQMAVAGPRSALGAGRRNGNVQCFSCSRTRQRAGGGRKGIFHDIAEPKSYSEQEWWVRHIASTHTITVVAGR